MLPLLYVDVSSLHDETDADDLVVLVRTFQREDWTDLRFKSVTSERYRRAVARLATVLIEANRNAEQVRNTVQVPVSSGTPNGDRLPNISEEDSPGLLDRIGRAEEAFPRWLQTIQGIQRVIELVGQLAVEAATDIHRGDAQGGGFGARLIVARRLARQLAEPAEQVWSLGNDFAAQLHDVDEGFRAIIEHVPGEVRLSPSAKPAVCRFFAEVRRLTQSAGQALDAIQQFINAAAAQEGLSRDLRPPLRRLRQGLTILTEARAVTDDWVGLIDASGVVCDEPIV